MKPINIVSLIHAKKDLSDQNFQSYIKNFDLSPKMRETELADVATLIEELQALGASVCDLNYFFVGYTIERISKEFDLLRVGKNYILNIELKQEGTQERIHRQLLQNAHYLRFLNVLTYNFTFVTSTKTLYQLVDGELQQAQLTELFKLLTMQLVESEVSLDDLFDPIHYLVSPLEEPQAFKNKEYFLTAQQTTFKMEIMNRQPEHRVWLGIEGGSGTGKTLLTYDIAAQYMEEGVDVVIVHCGPLLKGQTILIEQFGWRIMDISSCPFETLDCDVLIIDEAQNLTNEQLIQVKDFEERHYVKIMISYDPLYYFNGAEVIEVLEQHIKLIRFELKVIIRYNKEIQTFINCLFDRTYPSEYSAFEKISIQYFSDDQAARQYMMSLQQDEWKVIDIGAKYQLLEQTIKKDIIGKEFDQVAAVMDEHFFYKENLRLSCYGIASTFEQPTRVLFQALTRARKKIQLIIVNNEQVLENVMAILQGDIRRKG